MLSGELLEVEKSGKPFEGGGLSVVTRRAGRNWPFEKLGEEGQASAKAPELQSPWRLERAKEVALVLVFHV